MTWTARVAGPLVLAIGLSGSCGTAPASRGGKDELVRQATAALVEWKRETPGLEDCARQTYGYAMFSRIAKGALGIGAAHGRSVASEDGQHIGYTDLSQAPLGLQIGGQAYQTLLVFDNKAALDRFKRGQLDFSADGSGIVFECYRPVCHRSYVFSRPIGGAVGEAALGARWCTFVGPAERQ